MNIVHLCLSCFYYDGFSYQENLLVQQNVKDGHNVQVIASTESIDKKGKLVFLKPETYMGSDGALVNRVAYNRKIPKIIQYKIKSYDSVIKLLTEFKPDIIYFHGISAVELNSIRIFKLENPNVKIILDCHSDKYNSANGLLSKYILHGLIYKYFYKRIIPHVDKVFCISLDTIDFAVDFYKTPQEKIEFFPLGGVCLEDKEYFPRRMKIRSELNINDDQIMLLQTGKINTKKKVIEALTEFKKVKDEKLVYIIAGILDSEVEQELTKLISSDERIRYIGWVNADKLQDLLCGSDLYIQPGSQSATMQQSMCLRNPVILDDVKSHRAFVDKNGWLISDKKDIYNILSTISNNHTILKEMSERSHEIAKNMLDYQSLSRKIYDVVK